MKEETQSTGLELLNRIAGTMHHPKPNVVIEGGTALLMELKDKQIILGTRL